MRIATAPTTGRARPGAVVKRGLSCPRDPGFLGSRDARGSRQRRDGIRRGASSRTGSMIQAHHARITRPSTGSELACDDGLGQADAMTRLTPLALGVCGRVASVVTAEDANGRWSASTPPSSLSRSFVMNAAQSRSGSMLRSRDWPSSLPLLHLFQFDMAARPMALMLPSVFACRSCKRRHPPRRSVLSSSKGRRPSSPVATLAGCPDPGAAA